MLKWPNFEKFIKNKDSVILHNPEIQGLVLIEDLPKIIKDYNLDRLITITYEKDREFLKGIYEITFYNTGEIEKKVLFMNNNLDNMIDHIDPLNLFGRYIINEYLLKEVMNERNT